MENFNRDNLKLAITESIIRVYEAQICELNLYRNTLDCFASSIDAVVQNITMEQWLLQEKERQIQKTKQNAIGTLHEEIIGSLSNVENLPVGNLIDIVSHDLRIIAEVKNKHNTTKGNHKIQIYRDLSKALERYVGYTAYYVEILPRGRKRYNTHFTPSDNQTHSQAPARDDIKIIDGLSFYALLTGSENALREIYNELPLLTAEIINEKFGTQLNATRVIESQLFSLNYTKAYK
ncbi:Eco47II family restriction endonuclease [Proteus terrae]|uniref:Eco47II family restriction endonuclease n=1 Tax=Proteus terrae TaxID=1574161 RepID=UPI00370B00C3